MSETTSTTPWNLTDINGTAGVPAAVEPLAFKATKILVYVLIFVVSILGNLAVVAIILRSRIMRLVPGNLLILNLAFCDFLTPFISIPFDLAVEEEGEWLYGEAMCRIMWPAATLTTTSSSLTLAVIAFERYRSLMHPFKNRLTITQVKRAILGIHASSLLVVIPYVLVLDVDEDEQCGEVHWPHSTATVLRQTYTVTLFTVQYLAPLFFMACMYSLTSKSLVLSTERVRTASMSSVESLSTSDVRPRSGSFSNMASRRPGSPLSRRIFKNIEQERNVRVTKMFILVVIIFAVCMLPNQVVWLWADFGNGFENDHFNLIAIACRFFTYANCCLNPWIFFKFSREFRQGLRRVIAKVSCCVLSRRHVRQAYRSWRASRTATSMSAGTGVAVRSGQTFSSTLPSVESSSSSSSVFGRDDDKAPATRPRERNADRSWRGVRDSARGLFKEKFDHLKAISCSLLHANKDGTPKDAPKREENLQNAEERKLRPTGQGNIEINEEDLLNLPSLDETSC